MHIVLWCCAVIAAFLVGRLRGAAMVSVLAWGLLEEKPTRSMVGAFLLYASEYCPNEMFRRGFKNTDEVHQYLKSWEKA